MTESALEEPAASAVASESASESASEATSEATAEDDAPLVIFLGDSLTAGLGMEVDMAYPHLVLDQLREEGYELRIVNAAISGDTTAGGLSRLDWLLQQEPEVLVVGLGANDGLRGTELESTEENLRRIVRRAQDAGARVLLLGMLIPPNYGEEYAERFAEIYPRLEEELGTERVPFLLDGVAGDPELNMPDNIHPNARGHRIMADTVAAALRPILDDLESSD